MNRDQCDASRFDPASAEGFYESWFLRANHPQRPLAFWLRYTVFSPRGRPGEAIGELWAVCSDGERNHVVAAKSELPVAQCAFSRERLEARIGTARLDARRLSGAAGDGAQRIEWDLQYAGAQAPLLLLPEALYAAGLPRAKSLVVLPLARFAGTLRVNGQDWPVRDWTGSHNHNWGSRHTDRYAYGQVCGFDNAPDSMLELATAQVRVGPLLTPRMTPLVLRHGGREYALNRVGQALRARAGYRCFEWRFASRDRDVRIEGEIRAPRETFVGLRYYNPPGGIKHCLNSKLGSCTLRLTDRRSGKSEELRTQHRAAFELLLDGGGHGVALNA